MLIVPSPPSTAYTCPGERHPVSRTVHHARLSRNYAACRDCPHREDTGLVSLTDWETAPPKDTAAGLISTASGLRGRYLNDLTRRHAQQWATALAVLLWQQRPLTGRLSESAAPVSESLRTGPVVVVGYDERPASPDLALGVVIGLRQAGCHVLDIGQSTPAAWHFAAAYRQTDAGLFVTGAGEEASWTGLEFLGPGRLPLDPQASLANVMAGASNHIVRPTRFAGSVETFSVWSDYESQLTAQFHALRPLKVMAIVLSPLVERLLERLFAPLPCSLKLAARVPLSGPPLRWEVAAERLQTRVREESNDVGVLVGEDGRQFALVDETGRLIPTAAWQSWLRQTLQAERAELPMGTTVADDAAVTLAAVLRALSWSDAPLSERLSQ